MHGGRRISIYNRLLDMIKIGLLSPRLLIMIIHQEIHFLGVDTSYLITRALIHTPASPAQFKSCSY